MSIKSSEYKNRFNVPKKAISTDGIKYKILSIKGIFVSGFIKSSIISLNNTVNIYIINSINK